MLGDIGFAPELSTDGTAINLHRCPFRELAESNPEVVCGAHLGMIQGALAELGAAVSATRLIPFVQPDLCITTLTRTSTATAHSPAIPGSLLSETKSPLGVSFWPRNARTPPIRPRRLCTRPRLQRGMAVRLTAVRPPRGR